MSRKFWYLVGGWIIYLWMLLMLHGCIDVPVPQVTLTITVPDYIEECKANGYTQDECLGMLCMDAFPQQFGQED